MLHTGSAASRLLSVSVVWFAMALSLVAGMAIPAHADSAAAGEPPPLVLADFRAGFDLETARFATIAASVGPAEDGEAIRLCAAEQGEEASLTLTAPESVWDLSDYDAVVVGLRNLGGAAAVIHGIAGGPEAEGSLDNCRGVVVLEPGERSTLTVKLVHRPVDPGFAPFEPFLRYARNLNVRDGTVNAAEIASVRVALEAPQVGQAIEIDAISAVGAGAKGPVPFLPFVDEFGQYIHADWPGKVRSEEDFAVRRAEESAEMADWPGPPDWDEYGGWAAGPALDATGFFHPTKYEGKWWLVDPEGKLFWSYGPTGVGFGGSTPITDREQWFRGLPERDSAFGRCYGEGRGARDRYYRDKSYETFDFAHANLYRKYGPGYAQAVADLSHRLLRSWGFNTIANWSDMDICLQRNTPYVVAVHFGGPWLDGIPDAFDSRFRQTVRERMEQERGGSAGDPWCIGYFVQNELWWGYWDDGQAVALGALRAPATAAAKRVFVQRLRGKYEAIEALNESWGTAYASWHGMLATREAPDRERAEVARDCGEFGLEFCETYFSTVRDEVTRVAPDNLYLGCRFHGHIDLDLVEVAAKYCDVISYNVYDKDPGARLNRYLGVIDKPFIVGEFGIGSDPRQTPFRGDELSVDPEERPRALTSYLEKAFRHPLMVGAHFFQYRDQPITGRADGEAVLRGFINTADTPHFDLVQANRRAAYELYRSRSAGPDRGAEAR